MGIGVQEKGKLADDSYVIHSLIPRLHATNPHFVEREA